MLCVFFFFLTNFSTRLNLSAFKIIKISVRIMLGHLFRLLILIERTSCRFLPIALFSDQDILHCHLLASFFKSDRPCFRWTRKLLFENGL